MTLSLVNLRRSFTQSVPILSPSLGKLIFPLTRKQTTKSNIDMPRRGADPVAFLHFDKLSLSENPRNDLAARQEKRKLRKARKRAKAKKLQDMKLSQAMISSVPAFVQRYLGGELTCDLDPLCMDRCRTHC